MFFYTNKVTASTQCWALSKSPLRPSRLVCFDTFPIHTRYIPDTYPIHMSTP